MKELNSGVYMIINMVNQKVYVGSSKDLKGREYNHFSYLRNNKHPNCHLQFAFNKYGEQSFKWEVIKRCKKNQLLKWEQFYMNRYNSTNHDCGYNIVIKADHSIMSEETKKKISNAHIGKKKKYSAWNKGKKMSSEMRKKMSIASKGKVISKETREKLRQKSTGRKMSPEDIAKQWLSRKNGKGWNCTEETKKKLSIAHTGKKQSKEHIEKRVKKMIGKKHSEERREKLRKFNNLIIQEWNELIKNGYSYRKIGKIYRTNHTTVSTYLNIYYSGK